MFAHYICTPVPTSVRSLSSYVTAPSELWLALNLDTSKPRLLVQADEPLDVPELCISECFIDAAPALPTELDLVYLMVISGRVMPRRFKVLAVSHGKQHYTVY